jgi:cyclic beta-1,2-glucan synthetase
MNADAIGTVLVRLYLTRRNLLQWTTAAHTVHLFGLQLNLFLVWRQMYAVSVLSAGMAALIAWIYPASLGYAAPLLLAWFFSPAVAYWIGLPVTHRKAELSDEDQRYLRRIARRTWLFFEDFIGPQDNWLPPDHFQEHPRGVVAHRTSPTNIGLMLVSVLSANDLGYLSLLELSLRLQNTFRTLHQMEKYRGHLLNWYNTETLETLPVRYVSTVDSGNLAASLWVVRQACLRVAQQEIWNWQSWQGFLDILDLIESAVEDLALDAEFDGSDIIQFLEQTRQPILEVREQPGEWTALLRKMQEEKLNQLGEILMSCIEEASSPLNESALNNLRTWTERASSHLVGMRRTVERWHPGCSWKECLLSWKAQSLGRRSLLPGVIERFALLKHKPGEIPEIEGAAKKRPAGFAIWSIGMGRARQRSGTGLVRAAGESPAGRRSQCLRPLTDLHFARRAGRSVRPGDGFQISV